MVPYLPVGAEWHCQLRGSLGTSAADVAFLFIAFAKITVSISLSY